MIWVATDHAETRETLVPLIADKGYVVSAVECAEELRERFRFQVPKLVIIDCGMPESFETLQAIRENPRFRAVPVIMFSAAEKQFKDRALLMGANAYVAKGSMDWVALLAEIVHYVGPPSK